jgi:hypothetical protein
VAALLEGDAEADEGMHVAVAADGEEENCHSIGKKINNWPKQCTAGGGGWRWLIMRELPNPIETVRTDRA